MSKLQEKQFEATRATMLLILPGMSIELSQKLFLTAGSKLQELCKSSSSRNPIHLQHNTNNLRPYRYPRNTCLTTFLSSSRVKRRRVYT